MTAYSENSLLLFISTNCRLMLLEENQIAFHSEDGLIYDGVKDYSHQIAEMIGLGSASEFLQAGVSICLSLNRQNAMCLAIPYLSLSFSCSLPPKKKHQQFYTRIFSCHTFIYLS